MTAVLIISPTLFMGMILLMVGVHSYKKGKKYVSESKVIVGEIVDIIKGIKISDDPPGWFPIIKYWDERTNSYLLYKSSSGYALKFKYRIGARIELRYLSNEKGVDIRTNDSISVYGVGKQFIVVGSILIGISITILLALLIIS